MMASGTVPPGLMEEKNASDMKLQEFKMENLGLRQKLLKMKAMSKIKDVALRASYEKRIKSMEEAQNRASKTYGETRQATEEREIILRRQLIGSDFFQKK
jgi:hypothetical protein